MAIKHAAFTVEPPHYQLPAALELGVVRLQIANLERSLDYYQRVVGLRVLTRHAASATLGAFGDDRALVALHEKPGVAAVPKRGRLGLYHFAILLPNRKFLGQFLAHLRDLGEYAGMADHLVSEALYLTDPDGLGIEVYADRPKSSWQVTGTVIAMASDPLNVPDLLRAAGSERWSGAPSGTRIGHVHLFVGDLEQSSGFFHEALGFDTLAMTLPGALFLSAGGYHHHLGTNTWAAGAPLATDQDARLLEWTMHLPKPDDVIEAVQSLEASGYLVRREGDEAVVQDPWGTHVRLTSRV